jgi:hypothetical protein
VSFSLTCGKCNRSIKLTNENMNDYFSCFSHGYHINPLTNERDKNKILVYSLHDGEDGIICACGNNISMLRM